MSDDDRRRWDEIWSRRDPPGTEAMPPPTGVWSNLVDHLPHQGRALDLGCGRGTNAVWLARRGLNVVGLDISSVAIAAATRLAEANGISHRCRFETHDLDDGLGHVLNDGAGFDLIVCHMFRDRALDRDIAERLGARGLVAMAVLSEVDAQPGRFRAAPGELTDAFGWLEIVDHGEGDGVAWLVGRNPTAR